MMARLGALALGLVLLAGCAGSPLQYPDLPEPADGEPRAVELTEVPFFPQKAFQCGPAAMATVMNHNGYAVAPDDLTPQMYLPGRRGSLQVELLAAARRHGMVAYVHAPELAHLLDELRAGNPVLILQNLAFDRVPVWHYAVVVGFDLDADKVILRSGTTRRETMSMRRFERTWQRGDYWAITVHRPGEMPANAAERRYLEAVVGLEQVERWDEAETGYRIASERWPESLPALVGLGNMHYRAGDYEEAERRYREAVEQHPDSPAANHNLAWALIRQEHWAEATYFAERAASLASADQTHYLSALKEVARIRSRDNDQ